MVIHRRNNFLSDEGLIKVLIRLTTLLPMLAMSYCWTGIGLQAQEAPAGYVTPAQSVQKRGSAPGMKVKLIGDSRAKQYVIIFSKGDEAYSGLTDFAENYHVTSGSFTAIGALSSCVLAWFDMQKRCIARTRSQNRLKWRP